MRQIFQAQFPGSDSASFRPTFATQTLSQPGLIANLAVNARDLLAQHPNNLQPSSFLATIAPKIWAALALVIRDRKKIIGIVYLRERLLMGMRTGILVADASLGQFLVAETEHRESVFLHAIHAITKLSGVLSLRLRMSEVCMERSALSRCFFGSHLLDFAELKGSHQILRLPRTYQEFLGNLRPKTRATFRRYRRLGLEERTFIEELNPSEFEQAVAELLKKKVTGTKWGYANINMRRIAAAEKPFRAGLKNRSGEWMSVIGGWYESSRQIVFLQFNDDKKYHRSSPSLVMRSHLIESSIANGITEIIFFGGARGHLTDYCERIGTVVAYLDSPNSLWSGLRNTVSFLWGGLPENWRDYAYGRAPSAWDLVLRRTE